MKIKFLSVILLTLLLASCGGGSSSEEDDDNGGNNGGGGSDNSFRLSGTVTALPGVVVDSDVNDPNANFIANDSFSSAQGIANPVTVAGYLNLANRGSSGRSFASGDSRDFFRTNLDAGQVVSLNIASSGVDFDLYIYDNAGEVVASSESFNFFDRTEVLSVPDGGASVVEVRAFSGAAIYALSIGLSPTAELLARAAAIAGESQAEIVPNQAIVRFAKDASGLQAQQKLQVQRLNSFQTNQANQDAIFDREQLFTLNLALPLGDHSKNSQQATRQAIKALNNEPGIASAEPNYRVYPLRQPNDPLYSSQWHYPLINLENAWDISTGNPNVTIAVIDNGVLLSHPDLQGQLRGDGYDFVSDIATAGDGDGIDPNPDDPGTGGIFGDSSYHGSHVAGTVAARSDNQQGVAGVCWQCQILPVRVLGEDGGTSFDVFQGIRYAAGLSNDSGQVLSDPADIINLSLGGPGSSPAEEDVLNEVASRGIFIVAAAGNDDSNTPFYPAAYPAALSVSAVGSNRQKAPYSNFGSTIDLAAPGGNSALDLNGDGLGDGVLSTVKSGNTFNYQAYEGTSMAAPHVAGVIGLMKSVKADFTPEDFRALLQSGAITEDLGASGRDDLYGYGLIDAYLALANLADLSTLPTQLSLSPNSLSLVSGQSEAAVQVNQIGGSQSIANVEAVSDQSWLSATGVNVSNGLGQYRVVANTANLSPGRYSGSVTFSARASDNSLIDSKILSVNLQVFDSSVNQGGYQYLVLLEAVNETVADGANLGELLPDQDFNLDGILSGDYFLYVGSDLDNDGIICDAGEFCGAYPFLDPLQIEALTVNSDRDNLDFTSGLDSIINGLSIQSSKTTGAKNVAR